MTMRGIEEETATNSSLNNSSINHSSVCLSSFHGSNLSVESSNARDRSEEEKEGDQLPNGLCHLETKITPTFTSTYCDEGFETTPLTVDSRAHGVICSQMVNKERNRMFRVEMSGAIKSNVPPQRAVNLEFIDLSVCVQNESKGYKTILKGVSGRFRCGQLAAILGPSGAGKSTLMNILAGYRTKKVAGDILVNGRPRVLKTFKKQSCYIMQQNYLLQFLTVQESMNVAASLKLGDSVSENEKKEVVTDILEKLGLLECRHTRVSSLSGGERKRLSIAQELVNNPPVMFFDEPTSGLDSQNSFHCISMLRDLADEGRTVVCIIHQPSGRVLEKFDVLYALAEGQCVYNGTVPALVPFLQSMGLECPSYHNSADFLVEVSSGAYGSFVPQLVAAVASGKCADYRGMVLKGSQITCNLDLVSSGTHSIAVGNKEPTLEEGPPVTLQMCEADNHLLPVGEDDYSDYTSSFWTQFSVLFKRTFISILRDSLLTKLRIIIHVVVGLFIGILYYNVGNDASKILDNVSCIFFAIILIIFLAMMPTILTFPVEMNVFLVEYLNNWYTMKAYYFAKTMADVPFQILLPLLYIGITYYLTGQPMDITRIGLYTFICIFASLVAQSIGLAIGAALGVQEAVFMGPSLAVPAFLFSGFFITFCTIPVYLRWLTYASYVRYIFEGSMVVFYGLGRTKLDCSQAFCLFRSPEKILQHFNIEDENLWLDLVLLVVYFFIVRALCYGILLYKLRRQR